MMKKFMSRKEAAEELGVSTRQLDRYIRDGRVKAFKPYNGMRVLVHSDSLTQANLQSPVPVFSNFETAKNNKAI
ncbi:helix-turn-helix domain-containing protein [Winogradskyella forsetii]|uniref:helix-turn-helix domain-containing protein n=1 Tax=Winogradskyella forsetii TaxID=2686077 RepID=UPI0015BE3909|nr:helix-turn-helix domain-containing protein [Winogradskyella forsetii]